MPKASKKSGSRYRSSKSGRFTDKATAAANPDTTQRETRDDYGARTTGTVTEILEEGKVRLELAREFMDLPHELTLPDLSVGEVVDIFVKRR